MLAFCGLIILVNFSVIGYYMIEEVWVEYKQKFKRCWQWLKHKCGNKKVKNAARKDVENPALKVVPMNGLGGNESQWYLMQQKNLKQLNIIEEQDDESSFESVVLDKTANMTGI